MPTKTLLTAGLISLCLAMPAKAATLETIVQQLKDQGYTEIEIYRTWLGRIRIEAENSSHEREIILNRGTFEILRDYSEPHDEDEWHEGQEGGLISHE